MAKREPMVAIPRTERVALPKASVVGDANPADELKVTVYVRKQAVPSRPQRRTKSARFRRRVQLSRPQACVGRLRGRSGGFG